MLGPKEKSLNIQLKELERDESFSCKQVEEER